MQYIGYGAVESAGGALLEHRAAALAARRNASVGSAVSGRASAGFHKILLGILQRIYT